MGQPYVCIQASTEVLDPRSSPKILIDGHSSASPAIGKRKGNGFRLEPVREIASINAS